MHKSNWLSTKYIFWPRIEVVCCGFLSLDFRARILRSFPLLIAALAWILTISLTELLRFHTTTASSIWHLDDSRRYYLFFPYFLTNFDFLTGWKLSLSLMRVYRYIPLFFKNYFNQQSKEIRVLPRLPTPKPEHSGTVGLMRCQDTQRRFKKNHFLSV